MSAITPGRPSEPWRYYRSLRTWKRGDTTFALPRCRMRLDTSKCLREFGVIYFDRAVCDREQGHEGLHRSWPNDAQFGDAYAVEDDRAA